MPELPEIEVSKRVLAPRLCGDVVVSCRVLPPGFYRNPAPSELQSLEGRAIRRISRRGKYLVIDLEGRRRLILHLGMSGRFLLDREGSHARFEIRTLRRRLVICDPRRFGRVLRRLPVLGVEPLDAHFSPASLALILKGRKAPVKALIMDQRLVAGLGNIYATESLFEAGIRPGKAGGRLSPREIGRLASACTAVLRRAIRLGGSTLDDEAYLDPLGRPGRAGGATALYGRKVGRCGHLLHLTRRLIAGRRAIYCPVCQR